MAKIYKAPSSKGSRLIGPVLGIAACVLLFLAIPLTQLLTDYEKTNTIIEAQEVVHRHLLRLRSKNRLHHRKSKRSHHPNSIVLHRQ